MGYDEATADRIRHALAGRQDVVEKPMVGGLSFNVDGSMCCGVSGKALMVRVGSAGRAQALSKPHVRPMKLGGRALSGFVLVDPPGFRTDRALEAWVKRALAFVATLERSGG